MGTQERRGEGVWGEVGSQRAGMPQGNRHGEEPGGGGN